MPAVRADSRMGVVASMVFGFTTKKRRREVPEVNFSECGICFSSLRFSESVAGGDNFVSTNITDALHQDLH